jgi:hypothetical protein
VAATSTSYDQNGNNVSETVLLSGKKGEVLWTSGAVTGGFGNQRLGAEGTLALSFWENGASGTRLVWASGESVEVPGIIPIGGPSVSGRFPALLTPDSYLQELGWGMPGEAPEPLAYPAYYGGSPLEVEGALFYLGIADEAAQAVSFVRESEESLNAVPIGSGASHVSAVSPPFAVVRSDWIWNAPHFLADADAGSLTGVALPGDVWPLGMAYYNGATVDDEGGMWLPARNASSGGLYRTTDLGKSWQRVGKSFSDVWDATVLGRGGTFVLQATDTAGYFPMDPWQPPGPGQAAADVSGPSVEVVRPAEGIARTLDPASMSHVLSKSGACLAYVKGDRLRALSVTSGEEIEVGQLDLTLGLTAPVWIE